MWHFCMTTQCGLLPKRDMFVFMIKQVFLSFHLSFSFSFSLSFSLSFSFLSLFFLFSFSFLSLFFLFSFSLPYLSLSLCNNTSVIIGVELHTLKRHQNANRLQFLPYHFLLASVSSSGFLFFCFLLLFLFYFLFCLFWRK